MYRRRRAAGIGIFLLLAQLLQVGFNRIPPVTLGIIALNSAIYLRLLNRYLPVTGVSEACISFHRVWYNNDWRRIIFSPFFHLDDMHLYFNMASFLLKGRSLESRLGSGGMFYLISVFSLLTSLMLLAIDKCLSIILNDPSYLHTCAAGFSGVLFALKVVTTYHLPPGMTNVMMFRVPSRIACWVELAVIQLLVPRASFTGHLAGILVGLLYVKGPLKAMMSSVGALFTSYPTQPSYTYNSGRSGRISEPVVADEEDEALEAAIRESLRESRQNRPPNTSRAYPSHRDLPQENYEEHLSNEEVRRRRLQRFQS